MAHTNPNGGWSYKGKYSIKLRQGTVTDNLPDGTKLEGKVLTVENGTVQQVIGGIQFYAGDSPFSFGYRFIDSISDGTGKLLWKNRN